MAERMVQCVKFQKELPGLDELLSTMPSASASLTTSRETPGSSGSST